nr:hypothetical protein [Rhodoferax sp.]
MIALRRHRLFTALVALVSLLFVQLAVAGYVCPVSISGIAQSASVSSHAGMSCAGSPSEAGMDDAQPALCYAHCQSDQQSADTYQLPDLPVMPAITPIFGQLDVISTSRGVPRQATLIQRTSGPPLSVRNCCFRI